MMVFLFVESLAKHLRERENDVKILALKGEEDTIAAALRALADQREGTARQEGNIKSLAARLEAITEEISR
jgi:CRP-like cAMP-binding protein